LKFESNIHDNKISLLNDFTIAGGNGAGDKLNQLHYPLDVYVNDDQSIYVADFCNHRIVEWKHGETSGQVVAGGNGMGDDWNQLNCPTNVILDKEKNNLIICDMQNKRVLQWPRQNGTSGEPILSDIDCMGVAMDNNGNFYVSNKTANEVRRWEIGDIEAVGILVAGGHGKGNNLNQLSFPTCIFVDEDHSVYVSDSQNNRVMKWMKNAEEGIVVAGGNGKGNSLNQLSHPTGLFVDQLGTVYVADLYNHRIMRWPKGATEGNIVTYGNEELEQGNKFDRPQGISFDREGNLYIVDSTNDRVQRYNIDRS
jgi:sugar lactone lactonase YvrE